GVAGGREVVRHTQEQRQGNGRSRVRPARPVRGRTADAACPAARRRPVRVTVHLRGNGSPRDVLHRHSGEGHHADDLPQAAAERETGSGPGPAGHAGRPGSRRRRWLTSTSTNCAPSTRLRIGRNMTGLPPRPPARASWRSWFTPCPLGPACPRPSWPAAWAPPSPRSPASKAAAACPPSTCWPALPTPPALPCAWPLPASPASTSAEPPNTGCRHLHHHAGSLLTAERFPLDAGGGRKRRPGRFTGLVGGGFTGPAALGDDCCIGPTGSRSPK